MGTHPGSQSLTVVSRQSPPGPGQAPGVMRREQRAQATCGRRGGTTPTDGANGSRLLLYSFCGGDTAVGSLYISGSSSLALRVLPATALERSHALRYGQVTHMHWICILAGSHRV